MSKLIFAKLRGTKGHYHAAITRLHPKQRTLPHTHDFYEFFLCLSGTGSHHVDRRRVRLEAGTLAFIRPSDSHWFSTEAESLEFVNLAFPVPWWRSFGSLRSPPLQDQSFYKVPHLGHASLAAGGTAALRVVLLALVDATNPAEDGLIEACLALVRHFKDATRPKSQSPPQWLNEWVADLRNRELTRNGIDFWQERSDRSAEHLSRMCRRYFGAPPTHLLNRARIGHIQRRLRDSGGKVHEVALDGGFENLSYFYRVFKRQVGCTPREWLRSAAGPVPR